jgi:predicted aldo/keto reductase-like oxidoreductase
MKAVAINPAMRYRRFGSLDWKASVLGFGCMRLPTVAGAAKHPPVDEAESIRMIRHAVEAGVNYFDTAYVYHDGLSEVVLGKALEGLREGVRIATKSPVWAIRDASDFDRILDEQLARLRTDRIDFYLFHALNKDRWRDTVLKLGLLAKAETAIRLGRIGHLGFSFHDHPEAFVEILNGYDQWTFCQIQYNYMDIENQAGTAGLKLAASKGLAVVVMEPLLGGRLARPPETVRRQLDDFPVKRTPTDWALQWVWDRPEASVALSGMSAWDQLEENVASAGRASVGSLISAEHELIAAVRQSYQDRAMIPCTGCNYCLPCSNGVDIPTNFQTYNDAFLHEDLEGARRRYQYFTDKAVRADSCIECHECEERCPQKIPISDWMPKVHALLGAA